MFSCARYAMLETDSARQDADMVKRHLKMLLGLELNEKAPENR